MSQRLLKALGGTTSIVVAATLLQVAPAQAREPGPEPDALSAIIVVEARAVGPEHFNSSVKVDIPAGGTAQVTSPTLDATMTKAKIETTAPLSDSANFEEIALMLLRQPTPGTRLLACVIRVAQSINVERETAALTTGLEDFEATAGALLEARMVYCMRVASLVAEALAAQPARSARAAGVTCGDAPVGVKETVTRSGGSYTVTGGPPSIKKKNAKVKVKCKVIGTKTVMTLKAPKGQTLRTLLGPNIKFGVAMPSTATTGIGLTVAFKAP